MSDTTSKGWRYNLGLALFIIPFPIFFLTPIVIPSLDLPATQTASLIGGILVSVEIIWFASIPLLGKEGFQALKSKAFGWLKLEDKPVSKKRHQFGIVLLFSSILIDLIVQILIIVSHILLDEGQNTILLNTQANTYTIVQVLTTLGILASLFILGGQFWEKIKQAFTWESST